MPLVVASSHIVPPQFVVFSFDGSKSLEMWKETLEFARGMNERGKPIEFTYFINGTYFLSPEDRALYKGPHEPAGQSPIGFGVNREEVSERLRYVGEALHDGHEIGSHTAGHWSGLSWTAGDWREEFHAFNKIISEAAQRYGISGGEEAGASVVNNVAGFRAPELNSNPALYSVLADSGFRYDASGISSSLKWPRKEPNGLYEFPLATIKVGNRFTLSMDYNLYQVQSGTRNVAVSANPLWKKLYDEALNGYLGYFQSHYASTRSPVFIAGHFATWNDGVYWEAMKKTAEIVCSRQDVRCVTYRELARYLDSVPPERFAEYDKGNFKATQTAAMNKDISL